MPNSAYWETTAARWPSGPHGAQAVDRLAAETVATTHRASRASSRQGRQVVAGKTLLGVSGSSITLAVSAPPRRRPEKHLEVQRCAEELKCYLYPPWTSEEVRPSKNYCMRALCCGYQRKEAVPEYVTLAKTEREALKRMAYERGLYLGDLIGMLLRPEIEKWHKDHPDPHETDLDS
ncbi:hypothetical protein [Streptomyces sp. NPDC102264]|uniref:hypothetical protein n=1 Tax=Streptomyces sp. NPDC102264 TaxID=3366149 RepID=UPI0038275FC4